MPRITENKNSKRLPKETGCPTVGQNRPRNTDGSWRKKHSETGSSRK